MTCSSAVTLLSAQTILLSKRYPVASESTLMADALLNEGDPVCKQIESIAALYRKAHYQAHWEASVMPWQATAASAKALCTTATLARLSSRETPQTRR